MLNHLQVKPASQAESYINFNTIDLKKEYDYFNSLLFDNKLPQIKLNFSSLKRKFGQVYFETKSRTDHCILQNSIKLSISTRYKMTRVVFEQVLIHEMIHVYFLAIEKDPYEVHGLKFQKKAKELSKKIGMELVVDAATQFELSDESNLKPVLILKAYLNGEYVFALFNGKTKVSDLIERIESSASITNAKILKGITEESEFVTVKTNPNSRIRFYYINKNSDILRKEYDIIWEDKDIF